MSKMKNNKLIYFISWYFPSFPGGAEVSIKEVLEDYIKKGYNVNVISFDENFKKHIENLDGLAARVVQHEYDHIEGILFTDKLAPLKKRLLKKKLENISKGKISPKSEIGLLNIRPLAFPKILWSVLLFLHITFFFVIFLII